MKKVLISCYYGQVFIKAPRNLERRLITDKARSHFQELYKKPIIDLPDLNYETESEWFKKKVKDIDKGNEFLWDDIPVIELK